jgi:tRNA A-37 threonylcarbamoyl transferase component Bud32
MIATFGIEPGCVLAGKYEVLTCLGSGWESEVYKIRELKTRIERAAKIFFPHRNPDNRNAVIYAKKLHKLRSCPILIQYHTFEQIPYEGMPLTAFISDYVEGELLSDYLARQKGRRLTVFKGIHLLHALAAGIEGIHELGEYHGDLHAQNVVVQRLGLTFDLKLLDLYHRGRATRDNRQDDICSIIRLFYDAIGGPRRYAAHPRAVKAICCGLKRSLMLKKFRTVRELRLHLETQDWR